jgi:hypothetical protein
VYAESTDERKILRSSACAAAFMSLIANESRDVAASERSALMINTPDRNVCLILF